MQNLSLQQLFGENASQTASSLIIQKADLPGLTAATDNRGEQLLVALLLQVHQYFEGTLTDEQARQIADQQDRAITYDNRALYEKLNLSFWKRQILNRIQLDTFILDAFISPPTEPETPLISDSLNYQ